MLIDTQRKFRLAMNHLAKCKELTVDLETTGLRPYHGDRLCGVAVRGTPPGGKSKSYYFPFRHGEGFNLLLGVHLPELMALLSDPSRLYIGFNYKFDLQFMLLDGATLPTHIEDVMLAAHLMNENEPKGGLKLKVLADKYLGEGSSDEQTILYTKLAELGYKGKQAGGHMWRLPASDVAPYAIQDVDITWGLREFYREPLKVWRLDTLYAEVCQYLLITTKMEARGMLVDQDLIRAYMAEADAMIAPMKAKLDAIAGYAINANSPKQVCSLLGVSSSAEKVLAGLVSGEEDTFQRQAAQVLLDYRGWAKVNGTYYGAYLRHVDAQSVIHASLWLTGTVSGRLACSGPGLHGTPQYSEVYKAKDVFVARPGYTLVVADYSQAELRLATHYTRDPAFVEIFANDLDAHTMTAQMCGITRQQGKTINFGIIYGLGAGNEELEAAGKDPGGLASQLGIRVKEARPILNAYHKRFPGFKLLRRKCQETALARGYIRMWTGRIRRYGPTSPPHKAMPNLIQGGVAEVMRTTISRLDKELAGTDVHMLLQIHDSIMFEIPDDRVAEVVPHIVTVMQDFQFRVPMKVDVGIGKSWGKLIKS